MENEELMKSEEASPKLKEFDLEEASGLYKAKTGVGSDERNKRINCGDTGKGGTTWKMT